MKNIRPTIKTTALPLNPSDFGVGNCDEVPVSLTHCADGWHKWGIVEIDGGVTPLRPDHSMPGCATDGRVTIKIDGGLKDQWK